jgi:hypothetical protein
MKVSGNWRHLGDDTMEGITNRKHSLEGVSMLKLGEVWSQEIPLGQRFPWQYRFDALERA